MRSMTGFGQATGADARHAVTVTLRGVNHRFLEVKLRLGDEYRSSEPALQDLFATQLARGRVDAAVDVRILGERRVEVTVHRPVVMAAHKALEELVEGGLIAQKLTAGDLLRLPEALDVEVAPDVWEADDEALLLSVAGEALAQMVAGRANEGAKLAAVLAGLVDGLETVAGDLAELAVAARGEMAAALRKRLEDLLAESGHQLDEGRLEQEVAVLADKGDVREELDRLAAHLEHCRELLAAEGAVGKRLDFLSQEILRELNTVGSKCRNADMTRKVLDGKGLCEQLREQVQNVE